MPRAPYTSPRCRFRRLALALVVGLVGACDAEESCAEGAEGCVCSPDYRCLEGLACLSNYCVDPNSPGNPSEPAGAEAGGSGSADADNVAACEAFGESLECGFPGGMDPLMCDIYVDVACDISDYFSCLAENTSCNGDVLDASGWVACAELVECI